MEYFEVITNAQTGKVTQRPYTEDEIAKVKANWPSQVRGS